MLLLPYFFGVVFKKLGGALKHSSGAWLSVLRSSVALIPARTYLTPATGRGDRAKGTRASSFQVTDAEAVAAVARITNGSFRLIQRLFTQITRIRDINQLNSITKEAVEAARETLPIGT